MQNFTSGFPRIRIGGAPLERAVVLKWFYSLSRRQTSVGGKCALPSALLVIILLKTCHMSANKKFMHCIHLHCAINHYHSDYLVASLA